MPRPKGSKNKAKAPAVTTKGLELSVGDTISYPKPLGGTEKVVVERIETMVNKVSEKDLTKPETTLYLSNGRWMSGPSYLELINGE